MRRIRSGLLVIGTLAGAAPAWALVDYDQGQREVNGVQLLRDHSDPHAYYYLPQFPRLATKEDGTLELLCLKFVDPTGGTSGGLFHALIQFSLPPETVAEVEAELKANDGEARLVGPVPLVPADSDDGTGRGSFQVVSSVLGDTDEGGFTRSVITSGEAPLTPGSKAVVAAILNPSGATLLWDSLTGPTSDISVAIHASYEAFVVGYNAQVTAEVSTIYEHFSRVENYQEDYSRRQLREIVDDLQRDGSLKVEVFDRTEGLGLKASELDGILQTVTDKLVELMFDHETGWAADPPREVAVESRQILGRQKEGWLTKLFTGTGDQRYYTDDQFVLKNREDIRRNTFSLTLTKNSTIRVPVDTAGNLGGLYDAVGEDERFFRVVNLADPAFEMRDVHFQVDSDYIAAFSDTINFASVNFRKHYADQPDFTASLHFTHADILAGETIQDITFPRLGVRDNDWMEYEYQVRWSLRDRDTVSVPANEDQWLRSTDAAIALVPPLDRRTVEVDVDRELLRAANVATAVVEFAGILGGQPTVQGKLVFRVDDTETANEVVVYCDANEPVAYRVSWHSPTGSETGSFQVLDTGYLYIVPPEASDDGGGGGGP